MSKVMPATLRLRSTLTPVLVPPAVLKSATSVEVPAAPAVEPGTKAAFQLLGSSQGRAVRTGSGAAIQVPVAARVELERERTARAAAARVAVVRGRGALC